SLIADFLSEVPAQHNPTVGITAAIKKVIEDHRKKLDSEPSSCHKNEYAKVAALKAIKDIAEAEDFTNRLSLYRTVLGRGIDNAERRTANRDSVLKDLKISCGSASRGMQQSLSSDFMAALPKFGDRAARMLSERYGIKDYLNSTMQSKAPGALSHVMKKTKDWSEKAPSFDTLYEHLTSHSLNRSIAKHYLSKMDVSMEVINELQFMPNRRAFIEALSRALNGRTPDLPAFKLSGSAEQQHDNLALATA
ncbi:MAG: hypothetical protein JWQ00_1502, partial [Noviherbaspirillum sp.]|nr:hypothetical protein [Noviherbaspirillum sp.]